jgi:Putative Flp pilus-assembly TadE/G-like
MGEVRGLSEDRNTQAGVAAVALRARCERGQILPITALFVGVLVGLTVLVVNVGNWFGNDKILQRGADVAALAGARALALTGDSGAAGAAASSSAASNNLATSSIQVDSDQGWVKVVAFKSKTQLPQALVPTSAQYDRHANAKAAAFGVVQAAGVIPLAAYAGDVQIGVARTLRYDKNAPNVGPGLFGAVNTCNASGPGRVDDCVPNPNCFVQNNCPTTVVGSYGAPGAGNMKKVVDKVHDNWLNKDILLPVYDSGSGSGATFKYHVLGFAAFHLTAASASANTGQISGTFIRMIPVGGVGNPGQPNFGASAVYLVNYT